MQWDGIATRSVIVIHRWCKSLPLLALGALGALGCGGEGQQESPSVRPDSVEIAAPAPELALRAALEQALRGPAEPAAEHSWFSPATAGALRSVSVDSAGHAIVDFADLRALIPNATSSAGSAMLLEELKSAVFSVDGIRSVDYLIEGSCERFWEWLQYSCQTVHR